MAEEKQTQEEVKQEVAKTKEKPETKKDVKEEKKEKANEEVEVPKHLKSLVKEIEEMKLIDLAELVKVLEDKFGVSAAPVAVAAAPAGGVPAGGAEQGGKATVNVVLTGIGDKKIEVIKAVKEITQKGLKECKDLVDAAASEPQIVKEQIKSEEAEEMKKKLEASGATIELK